MDFSSCSISLSIAALSWLYCLSWSVKAAIPLSVPIAPYPNRTVKVRAVMVLFLSYTDLVSLTLVAVLLLNNSSDGGLDGLGHRNLGRFLVLPDGHTVLVQQSKPTTQFLVGRSTGEWS